MKLRHESWAFDWNLMDSGMPDMLRTWNEYEGPKSQARELQRRFKVSNLELKHYEGTRRR